MKHRKLSFFRFLIFFISFLVIANITRFKTIVIGDVFLYLNPLETAISYFSSWAGKINNGVFNYNIVRVFPFGSFWFLFSKLTIPNNLILFLWLFLNISFSWLGMYEFILYLFQTSFLSNIPAEIAFIGSSLYIFNIFSSTGALTHDNYGLARLVLPWAALYFYKGLKEGGIVKNAIFVALLSTLLTAGQVNFATVSIVPIFLLSVDLFFLPELFHRKLFSRYIFFNILTLILTILINLWWLVIFLPAAKDIYIAAGKTNTFKMLGSGQVFDYFRFMGSWGFRAVHYLKQYLPYGDNYYAPLLIITTLITPAIVFANGLFVGKLKIKERLLVLFIIFGSLMSICLAKGTLPPYGHIYEKIYNAIPILWMYREPFGKFTPLVIVFFCLGISLFLYLIKKSIKQIFYIAVASAVFLLILINSYPLVTGESLHTFWNAQIRNNRIEIPKYWQDAIRFLAKKQLDQCTITHPPSTYGTSFSWIEGLGVAGDPGTLLFSNRICSYDPFDMKDNSHIFNLFYTMKYPNPKLLSLLNVRYLVQYNDLDWRYLAAFSGKFTPEYSKQRLEQFNFRKINSFGMFDYKLLMKIPNDEPDGQLHASLYNNLIDKPALVFYRVDDKNYVPHIYVPDKILKTGKELKDLPDILTQENISSRPAIYFKKQNKTYSLNNIPNNIITLPTLEYKRINGTKYEVIVHGAKDKFPLVLNEAYHQGWKLYFSSPSPVDINNENINDYKLADGNQEDQANFNEIKNFSLQGYLSAVGNKFISKKFQGTIQNDNLPDGGLFETSRLKTVFGQTHSVVNGYANSWLIDTKTICKTGENVCSLNKDGSYSFKLIIEFSYQTKFYLAIIISFISLVGFVVYLFIIKYCKK